MRKYLCILMASLLSLTAIGRTIKILYMRKGQNLNIRPQKKPE